jgi:hypothetical protein
MKRVYAVGVFQLDTSPDARRTIKDQRLWHLFAKLEEAEKCVLENRGDLFEYYYNYALIEEIYVIDSEDKPEPGEFGGFPKEWWFVADYTQNPADPKTGWREPVIFACDKPACLEKTVYFWVG